MVQSRDRDTDTTFKSCLQLVRMRPLVLSAGNIIRELKFQPHGAARVTGVL